MSDYNTKTLKLAICYQICVSIKSGGFKAKTNILVVLLYEIDPWTHICTHATQLAGVDLSEFGMKKCHQRNSFVLS